MRGIAYGVGVGPGDPELMTLKAVRIIRENDVIAVPGKDAESSAAYQTAVKNIPELAEKELVPIYMPMVRDMKLMRAEHEKGANILKSYLDKGKNIVYLTLGDPTIYCTFSYLQRILEADGYRVQLVSGVNSFCAAAARLNIPLAEGDEQVHIFPAVHKADKLAEYPGTYILMKSASGMSKVKIMLNGSGRSAAAVENCGMKEEKVYLSVDEIPDDAGYFSLIIAKNKENTAER